jgi:hypothetical protein
VHALADEALDRLALGGDLPEIAVLELARAALERGQPRMAVDLVRAARDPSFDSCTNAPRCARQSRARIIGTPGV